MAEQLTIDYVNDHWEKDSVIELANLTDAARLVPKLHAKYLRLFTTAKRGLRDAETSYYRQRGLRTRYYNGEMTKKQLDEMGWEPFLRKLLKAQVEDALREDLWLEEYFSQLEERRLLVAQIESILKAINSRTWDIKNTIAYLTYTSGG